MLLFIFWYSYSRKKAPQLELEPETNQEILNQILPYAPELKPIVPLIVKPINPINEKSGLHSRNTEHLSTKTNAITNER